MKALWLALALIGLLLFFFLRRKQPSASTGPAPDLTSGVVRLKAHEVATQHPDQRSFDLAFSDGSAESRVRFSVTPKDVPADQPAAFTKAMLTRLPGSSPSPLLGALAAAHGGNIPSQTPTPIDSEAIDVAFFGAQLSVGASARWNVAGAFTNEPPGDWLVVKLFVPGTPAVPDADEPGELFLAVNSTTGEAMFLVKDPDYWPQLASGFGGIL